MSTNFLQYFLVRRRHRIPAQNPGCGEERRRSLGVLSKSVVRSLWRCVDNKTGLVLSQCQAHVGQFTDLETRPRLQFDSWCFRLTRFVSNNARDLLKL